MATMTVEELIVKLGDLPAEANVALNVKHGGEAEEFIVMVDEDGWVILEG